MHIFLFHLLISPIRVMHQDNNQDINIEIRNQTNYENKLVIKQENHLSFVFSSLIVFYISCFAACIVFLFPHNLFAKERIPQLVLILFIAFNGICLLLRKVPSLKTYIILISFLLGLLIGV